MYSRISACRACGGSLKCEEEVEEEDDEAEEEEDDEEVEEEGVYEFK